MRHLGALVFPRAHVSELGTRCLRMYEQNWVHRDRIQKATILERWPSAETPDDIRDRSLLSFVNHRPERAPEITPPCPDTGQRSAFSFDSPALTAVAQIMGSPGSKPSPEVTWNHTLQKNNLTTSCNMSVRRIAGVPSFPCVESTLSCIIIQYSLRSRGGDALLCLRHLPRKGLTFNEKYFHFPF